MCLFSVKGTPEKTSGLGWKVFRVEDGKLIPGNRGRTPYEYDKWYFAEFYWNSDPSVYRFKDILRTEGYPKVEYRNGFHIAFRREDARTFVEDVKRITKTTGLGSEVYVIRQVEYRGAHTQGMGNENYFGGPQVIADEIRILPPRKGGSAYAKEKKASKQPVIENGVAL